MQVQTNTTDRKGLAKALAEFTGEVVHYMGPPTFNYTVGQFIIDRNAVIFSDSGEGEAALRIYLEDRGFIREDAMELNITLPAGDMDADAMKRLVFMIHSRQFLLNRVTRPGTFAVSEDLIDTLENNPPADTEAFLALLSGDTAPVSGLSFQDGKVTFTFPMSRENEKNRAYGQLAAAMLQRVRDSKHISPKEQKPENEKYYFRIWLLNLGLGGPEGKEARKYLMEGLKGHSAFRTDADAEKFKADMKAKRAAQKAEKASPEEQ